MAYKELTDERTENPGGDLTRTARIALPFRGITTTAVPSAVLTKGTPTYVAVAEIIVETRTFADSFVESTILATA